MAGMTTSGTQPFWGFIDNCRVWTRTITAAEALSGFLTGQHSNTSLFVSWLFNEGSGSSTIDDSGNSITGTITAATYSTDVVMKLRS